MISEKQILENLKASVHFEASFNNVIIISSLHCHTVKMFTNFTSLIALSLSLHFHCSLHCFTVHTPQPSLFTHHITIAHFTSTEQHWNPTLALSMHCTTSLPHTCTNISFTASCFHHLFSCSAVKH